MEQEAVKYTLLPFLSPLLATRLFLVFGVLGLLIAAVRAVVFRRSLRLHRAPAAVAFSVASAAVINVTVCTVFYWYWALPVCVAVAAIYAFTVAGEVKEANAEERIGVWGLNREIRRIRGELFNDMSIEEQLEYSRGMKEFVFRPVLFVIAALAAPGIFILVCHLLPVGYLFFPVPM